MPEPDAGAWRLVLGAAEEHIQARRFPRARDLLEQVVALDPGNRDARDRLGMLRAVDKRRARRIPVDLVAFFRRGGEKAAFPGVIVEMSRTGLHVLLSREIGKGDPVDVEIPSRISLESPLRLPGACVWSRREGTAFHAGIHLPDANRDQQIALLERSCEAFLRPPDER